MRRFFLVLLLGTGVVAGYGSAFAGWAGSGGGFGSSSGLGYSGWHGPCSHGAAATSSETPIDPQNGAPATPP
ncbi:MAG: hypothetical protein Q8P18_01375 [Pseudomonadota bacterium]|nr:hypothetical protein [Pseudomonadota bacterium]